MINRLIHLKILLCTGKIRARHFGCHVPLTLPSMCTFSICRHSDNWHVILIWEQYYTISVKALCYCDHDPVLCLIQLISPGQNGQHFTDDVSKCMFINEKFCQFFSNFTEVCSQGFNMCFGIWSHTKQYKSQKSHVLLAYQYRRYCHENNLCSCQCPGVCHHMINECSLCHHVIY